MSLMHDRQETPEGQALRPAVGMRDMCEIFGIVDELEAEVAARTKRALELGVKAHGNDNCDGEECNGDADGSGRGDGSEERARKRQRVERIDDHDVTVMDIEYDARKARGGPQNSDPKTKLSVTLPFVYFPFNHTA